MNYSFERQVVYTKGYLTTTVNEKKCNTTESDIDEFHSMGNLVNLFKAAMSTQTPDGPTFRNLRYSNQC